MTVYGTLFALGAGYSGYQVQFIVDKAKKQDGFFTVNKTFLPAKIFYFLFMGSMVSFLPFVPVYMEQLGLNSFQIGIIRSIQPIGTIIACPLWGSIADKFSIHRKAVIIGIFFGGIATGATYFTPSSVSTPDNSTSVSSTQPPFSWDSTYITFSVIMALSIVSIAFFAHVTPTIDANVMQLLKEHPETDYGRQRLWGAVGWGSVSALTGFAMDRYIDYFPEGNRFLPAYILFALLMVPAIIPVFLMRFPEHTTPESISGGILRIFKKLNVVIFFFIAAVCGLSLGVINTFQFLFLNELKAPSLVMGLTLTFTCISEIPFMYIAGKIIHRTGEEMVFIIALVCYSIRFYLYSILKNPWLILPIELLHGICFGALWPAMASFANKISPAGMGATVQNLMSAVSRGLGQCIGTTVGGYIYDNYGPNALFLYCGYLCTGTTVFFAGYMILDRLITRFRPRPTSYDEI